MKSKTLFLLSSEGQSETLKEDLQFMGLPVYRCRRGLNEWFSVYPYVWMRKAKFIWEWGEKMQSSHNIIKRGEFFSEEETSIDVKQNLACKQLLISKRNRL